MTAAMIAIIASHVLTLAIGIAIGRLT